VRELTIREMRKNLGRLGELVEGEGEVVITRRGTPIARLLPVRDVRRRPSHAELRASMPFLEVPSEKLVRADRDER
jgi:prevent-host-death family protein